MSALVYLNNRYHDPQLGVFISVDPLVTATGEPYIYASGNPTTLSDPTGLCSTSVVLNGCRPSQATNCGNQTPEAAQAAVLSRRVPRRVLGAMPRAGLTRAVVGAQRRAGRSRRRPPDLTQLVPLG